MATQPNYGAFSGNDYTLELSDIERRKKLAQALQEQGMAPAGGTETVGGWAIRKSPLEGLSKAMQQGLGAYQQQKLMGREKEIAGEKRAQEDIGNNRLLAASLGNTNYAQDPTKLATALPQWMTDAQPDLLPKPPNKADQRQLMLAALLQHPNEAMRAQGMAAMIKPLTDKPESAFAKVDPSKFTAPSILQFAKTNDYADLVPRDKLDFQNSGGSIVGLNPYSGSQVSNLATSMKPGESAKLAQDERHWGNLSANQVLQGGIDQAKLANQGAQTNFETGGGVSRPIFNGIQQPQVQFPNTGGGAPQGAPMPNAAPTAGVPRPAVAPQGAAPVAAPNAGMTGATRQAVLKDAALKTQDMQVKREFNMGGINDTIGEARRLLTGGGGALPTSSGVGQLQDWAGSLVGMAPKGSEQADQLRSIAGTLTSKVPRMEGPQSDKDVQLYREMAGQVGDAGLPLSRRLAALDTVEKLYGKYEKQSQQQAPQTQNRRAGDQTRTQFIAPQGMAAQNVLSQADAIIGR